MANQLNTTISRRGNGLREALTLNRFISPPGARKRPHAFFSFLAILIIAITPRLLSAQEPKKKGPPPALVEVATVLEKEVLTRVSLVGSAEPWLETVVAAEEAGKVRNMMIEEGDRVKKNQPLCEQDTSQLDLKIKSSRADLAEAEVLHAQDRREMERQKRLHAINSVAEKAYEDAKYKVEASEKKLARLNADLQTLEDQLKKRKIKAPVSGVVVKRYCLVGQWLGEGEPVATLVVSDPMRVLVPVPERYIRLIKKGHTAQVTFDALPGRTFKGKIVAIVPRADEAARTFPVRIQIPNADGSIKAGMLGRANLPLGRAHRAILVPKDALVLSNSGKAVFVVSDQTVRSVPVKTGPAHGPLIEVEGELKAGQQVVTRGNERLRTGQAVKVITKAGSR